MTTDELNTIVAAVVAELEKSGVDFDYKIETPLDTDTIFVIRGTAPNYQGAVVTWKGLLDIITAKAEQAKTDAVKAKDIAESILSKVTTMKTDVEQTVSDFNQIATEKKSEIENVYQSDLLAEATAREEADNALGVRIDDEEQARAEADTALGARIDSETTTRESQIAELDKVNTQQKYDIENLKAKAEGQIYREEIIEAEAYSIDIPSSVAPYAELQKIGGKSVVWNQLFKNFYINGITNGVTFKNNNDGSMSISGTSTFLINAQINGGIRVTTGHIYYIKGMLDNGSSSTYRNKLGYINNSGVWSKELLFTDAQTRLSIDSSDIANIVIFVEINNGIKLNKTIIPQFFDLTLMFGSGNEPTLEECQKIFTADYYPYNVGTIKSFPVQRMKSVGKNLVDINILKGILQDDGYYLCKSNDNRLIYKNTSKKSGSLYVKYDLLNNLNGFYLYILYTDGTRSNFYSWSIYQKGFKTDANKTVLEVYQSYATFVDFKIKDFIMSWEDEPYVPYRKPIVLDVLSLTTDLKSAGSIHDEWQNGKIIKRVGSRVYTSGDESDSTLLTDGTTTYYPLENPTEEEVPEIDNYLEVEGGGSLTFESDDTIHMPVPSTDRFVVDLT